MARKSVIKISHISKFFGNELKLIEKGENAVESGHIASMTYVASDRRIEGHVFASMKDKSYLVEMTLQENGDIYKGSCECPRGKLQCHHMAALLLYAHNNISITDTACVWDSRKTTAKAEIKTVSELFPSKKFKAVQDMPSNIRQDVYKDLVFKKSTVGFSWLLSPEPEKEKNLSPDMETIIFSEEFKSAQNKEEFLETHCSVDADRVKSICVETLGQSSNWKWSKMRNFRLTSSNFGIILNAMKREKFPPSLFKKIRGEYILDGVKAIQWGRQNENTAAEAFVNATGLKIKATGLWLHECGLLATSPDKLIEFKDGSIGTLEVKCPYKFRNELLSDALQKAKKYIVFLENGQYKINKGHDYYHQIQGQLHIVNCDKGFLVLWTLKECLVFQISKDKEWFDNIGILKTFYYKHYISWITENISR